MNKINLNKAYYFCPLAVDMCTDETQTSQIKNSHQRHNFFVHWNSNQTISRKAQHDFSPSHLDWNTTFHCKALEVRAPVSSKPVNFLKKKKLIMHTRNPTNIHVNGHLSLLQVNRYIEQWHQKKPVNMTDTQSTCSRGGSIVITDWQPTRC